MHLIIYDNGNDFEFTQGKGFITAEDDNQDYLSIINEAKEKLNNIACNKGLTVEELVNNREDRDEAIKELRKKHAFDIKGNRRAPGGIK